MIPTVTVDLTPIGVPEETDPLTIATQQRRQQLAFTLCARAHDKTSWIMADRLARAWELGGCSGVGVPLSEVDG